MVPCTGVCNRYMIVTSRYRCRPTIFESSQLSCRAPSPSSSIITLLHLPPPPYPREPDPSYHTAPRCNRQRGAETLRTVAHERRTIGLSVLLCDLLCQSSIQILYVSFSSLKAGLQLLTENKTEPSAAYKISISITSVSRGAHGLQSMRPYPTPGRNWWVRNAQRRWQAVIQLTDLI